MSTDDGGPTPTPPDGPAFVAGTVMDPDHESLARTYGEALLNAAEAEGAAPAVLDELDELVALAGRLPELGAMMASPSIAAAEKDRVLVRMFEAQAHPVVLRFLRVLNRSGRLGLMPSIVGAARRIDDARRNRQVVQVRSAVPLEAGEREALAAAIARSLGRTPILVEAVDPSILGGLVVQVGDMLLDTSVRSQLDRMRRGLVQERLQALRAELGASATAGA
jgi:F-type H+-transporting ATPase subunit delta